MSKERELFLVTLIYLLTEETKCLYSVLSEWDTDKTCYLQMNRANQLRDVIESLEHKL